MYIWDMQCMFIFAISREAYETIDIEIWQKQVDDHHFKPPFKKGDV